MFHRTRVIPTIMIVFLLTFMPPQFQLPEVSAAASLKLAVYAAPPKLTADGQTYPAIVVQIQKLDGSPTIAAIPVLIHLTSSSTSVATVQDQATIPVGDNYVTAKITTTQTPGATTISASASGFDSGSAEITTTFSAGTAAKLVLFAAPSALLPNRTNIGFILVQLQDSRGLLARAPVDIQVNLTSSQTNVGTVDASATIPSGATHSGAQFYGGVVPGTTTITGSASGLQSGSTTVSVKGNIATRLAVYAAPNKVILGSGEEGILTVQLQDSAGIPARATADVTVTVTSSDTGVVTVPVTVVVPAGENLVTAKFRTGGGSTDPCRCSTITASAQGFVSGLTGVTAQLSAPTGPFRLRLHLAPPTVLADEGMYRAIAVQVEDQSGNAVPAGALRNVTLTSSRTYVGTVTHNFLIPGSRSFEVANFSATFFVGDTDLTASAQDLESDMRIMRTSGRTPEKIVVSAAPQQLPANGEEFASVVVQLQDSTGFPANAQNDTIVLLSSARTDVGEPEAIVTIRPGETYVLAKFRTTPTAGTTTITASTPGLTSGSTDMTTVEPYPSVLTLFAAPHTIPGGGSQPALIVQLQDSTQTPAKPINNVTVSLTSSDTSAGIPTVQVTITPTSTYVIANFSAQSVSGKTTITASSSGFKSSSLEVSTIMFSLTAFFVTLDRSPIVGESVQLSVIVSSEGIPLPNATLTWTALGGILLDRSAMTSANGIGNTNLTASDAGEVSVTAQVTKVGFNSTTVSTKVVFVGGGASGSEGGIPFWVWPIAAVAILVPAAYSLFRYRSRKGGTFPKRS